MKKSNRDFLLWSINIEGLSDIYIFGSIHTGSPDINRHLPKVQSIIDQVDLVLNEVEIDRLSGMSSEVFLEKEHEALDKKLSKAQYTKFWSAFYKVTGQDLNHYKNYSPFFINYVFLKFLIKNPSAVDVDSHLYEYAVSQAKQTGGLENFEKHFDTIFKIPYKHHLHLLKQSLSNFSKARKQFNRLESLYSNAQMTTIYKQAVQKMGGYKKLLLYDRNIEMTQSILKHAKTHSTLGIMGVAHLGGQKGVLNLLRKQGAIIKGIKTL